MKVLFIIFVLLFVFTKNNFVTSLTSLTSSSSSSSSSDCKQTVYSVSEVNPYNYLSPIVIKGIFCLTDASKIQVQLMAPYAYSNTAQSIECGDIVIDSLGETITCKLVSTLASTQPTNFTILAVVMIYTPIPVHPSIDKNSSLLMKNNDDLNGITPTYVLGISNYLFTNGSCMCGDNNNGECDVANTCRCNEGYASYDCSVKVLNETALSSPIALSYDTFKISTKKDDFEINLSHIVANSHIKYEDYNFQKVVSSLSVINKNQTSNGISYSAISDIVNDWFNELYYNVTFNNNNQEPSFTYTNYKGSYLPMSSSSALITINPTINSTSGYFPFIVFNNTNSNGSYSMIIEISNSQRSTSSMKWSVNDVSNSISFINKNTNSLLVFSLSDIYSFNQSTVPNHAYLSVVPVYEVGNLIGYKQGSIYLSITIPQTVTPIKSGTYTIQLMVNAYNIDPSDNLGSPRWIIGVIIGVIIFIVLVIVIAAAIYIKRRYKYHHHHHDHHHHNENHSLLH